MHIVVCVKQVLDPELPTQYFRLDPETKRPQYELTDLVIDSYAENALELAIQLRDKTPGAKVTAICVGDEHSEEALRRALSFTADHAVRVWDPSWTHLDGQAVGHILARTIQYLGGADLVLTGCQASDVEEGLVGPVIAEELGISCATMVSDIEIDPGSFKVTCDMGGGKAVYRIPRPGVCTIISAENNVPRLPKIKDVRMARIKPIQMPDPSELHLDAERRQAFVRLENAFVPDRNQVCEMISGQDEQELARNLTDRLMDLNVI